MINVWLDLITPVEILHKQTPKVGKTQQNLSIINLRGLPRGDGNIFRYHLSKLYHPKVGKIISENFIKIG